MTDWGKPGADNHFGLDIRRRRHKGIEGCTKVKCGNELNNAAGFHFFLEQNSTGSVDYILLSLFYGSTLPLNSMHYCMDAEKTFQEN